MDLKEEVQQNNMISNLPLLFANGYPTSLDRISESQLENFIPFMVQCSLGYINLQNNAECSEPEWWPEDLPFIIPFAKPKKFVGNWMEKMKEIVVICYQFHRSVFLLRFCNDLAAYEHASLRFINNQNSTTSLFDRRSNKLLVTFRNENMSYDQPQRTRKCLLQQKQKNDRVGSQESQQMMVEPAPFDIYLCEHCDAELYSKEAILEHERTCKIDDDDDDDVILCDTPEPKGIETGSECPIWKNGPDNEKDEQRIGFLSNFDLVPRGNNPKPTKKLDTSATKEENAFMILDRNMRLPRRNRTVQSLTRCPTIPLSSPAGRLLLRSTKTNVSSEYLMERLERIERFCHTSIITRSSARPKYMEKKGTASLPHCTFKKPLDYSSHLYVFPRRQFSQRKRAENFLILNSQLIKRCRPISVRLKKITDQDIKIKHQTPAASTKLNIKLTRDTSRNSNWKISSTTTERIVDTIDLCSSDEEDKQLLMAQQTQTEECLSIENTSNTPTQSTKQNSPQPQITKPHLNGIKERLNTSEVSLIPIRKALNNFTNHNNNKNEKLNQSIIRLVSSSNVNDIANKSENSGNSYYEGNIVFSPSPTENGIALPKALQPSLYIFSNQLAALVNNKNSNNFKIQNQENQLKNNTPTISIASQIEKEAVLTNTPSDWYAQGNMTTLAKTTTTSNTKQNHRVDGDCPPTNMLVPNFNSQNRIVSIDLTS